MRQVTIYANGLVVKQWANGKEWSEYPCVYDWRPINHPNRVGYDKPEAFSQKERRFIQRYLRSKAETG